MDDLTVEDEQEAQLLANAARSYISVRTDGAGEVYAFAKKWSPEGWQAVARSERLTFVPWGAVMERALEILGEAVRN